MEEKSIGKKFVLSDKNLKINFAMGNTKVIARDKITKIESNGGIFWGIVNIIFVFTAIKGLRMLAGYSIVTIGRQFDEDLEFWTKSKDVKQLKQYI